jgi:tetratricopeptide (TPR) repeat protein
MSADATCRTRALFLACLVSSFTAVHAELASAQAKPSSGTATSAQAVPAQPSATAEEGEEKARAHFRLGRAYYDNGDFAQAAVEFESAYRISQRAALLYNIYLAYRDASDMRHAADALRKYLELEHNIENRGQLEARLAALDHTLAEEAANPQPAAPAPVAAPGSTSNLTASTLAPAAPAPMTATEAPPPSPSTTAEPAAPVASSSRNLTLPVVLMASGGALMAGSLVTGILTLGKRSDLSDARSECEKLGTCNALSPARVSELDAERSSGKTLATITDVLLFGGLAVAATGVVLLFLDANGGEHDDATRASAAVICAPGACVGRLGVRF